MTTISFARDLRSVAAGARTLAVLAPARRFTRTTLGKLLAPEQARLVTELAADTKPGDLGRTASTLTGSVSGSAGKDKDKGPRRLVAGVLPDRVSRYNCPSRAEPIRRATKAALGPGTTGLVLVLDKPEHQLSAAVAVARALPLYSARSKKPSGRNERKVKLLFVDSKGAPIAAGDEVRRTVEMVREAASLVDAPPSELGPAGLAKRARALLAELPKVRVREIVGADLSKHGLGGIAAVGRAGEEAPRLLIATYDPSQTGSGRGKTRKKSRSRKKADARHLALVGKGISFDTGGLHLKPRVAMNSMKSDMGGAAAVLGAFCVLAATGYPHELSVILCLAENAIGPTAYKPDDILTMHSGKTVEVNNTDAEGRLVLADGLSYATRVLGVDTVIDAATLTGAQSMATGVLHAAVVTNDAGLEKSLVDAGRVSGDLVHPLPFAPELYQREFESKLADMRNSVKNRGNAQASCAAQFLYAHIDDCDVRWGHVDLAGPSMLEDRGTGFGVALLSETLRSLA
ncbi:M17 family metallopeptidase [Haliangium sp.]|uniref:M17 family metallopeptidase n=1 Tax=Haliangium sp. TaxID=2663208 RepID=UPI003D0F981F